jgi:CW-type Zinc Finger
MAATNSLAHLDPPGLTPAQKAVNEQMRKALEEDQYSANGSIVDTDTDEEDHQYVYKGQAVRLDRTYLIQAAKKHNWLGGGVTSAKTAAGSGAQDDLDDDDEDAEDEILSSAGNVKQKSSKSKSSGDKKKRGRNQYSTRGKEDPSTKEGSESGSISREISGSSSADDVPERDEGSIFGQTTGASNSTWVECDKCKKWRRLRGVVDERKLPPKWYCSMNKNDPERARCSAPEEEYDAAHTPESAADARTRKHLRVWVRRLQCNEQYESRLPTLTRGKKRAVASSSKEPHEWIRCCNPSCGKWRAVLRIMDAKQNVIERTNNGEWYCVMNTWDEKTASCAAPQENLPAVGCPPWVLQDE